jgi:hypothetical protein
MLQFFEGLKAEICLMDRGGRWSRYRSPPAARISMRPGIPPDHEPRRAIMDHRQVPLEWCLQPGVKLDFRHLPDGYVATAEDVEAELKRIGTLSPLEIVVVNTSAGAKYGRPDYVTSGCAWAMRRRCTCSSAACG